MSIPTLLIFKNGEEVDRIVGVVPRRYIEARLAALTSQKITLKDLNEARGYDAYCPRC